MEYDGVWWLVEPNMERLATAAAASCRINDILYIITHTVGHLFWHVLHVDVRNNFDLRQKGLVKAGILKISNDVNFSC